MLLFPLSNIVIYFNCFLIFLCVLFTSETSVLDIFAEQYGNYKSPKSEIFLNYFIATLIFILFFNTYLELHSYDILNQ